MLELSKREKSEYSIRSAIASMLDGGQNSLKGLEREAHDELAKSFPQKTSGCLIPTEIFEMRRNWKRDLTAGTFGNGGAFVPTIVDSDVVPILRNKLCAQRLGMRVMTGLSGNVAIPRQSGAATVYSLPEQATLTKSTQALDQILLTPHRVGAYSSYTRQLILQSSVGVENFIRDDLNEQIAVKLDSLILQGQGAGSEPTGILNTSGIGSLTFGGTATWSQITSFENALAKVNADGGKMGWAVTPNVRNRWKAIAKTGVGVSTTVPIFLWDEKNQIHDGTNDCYVNGYRGAATNNVLNDLVFFGNWDDAVLGQFGDALEIIVDQFTQSTDATIRIVANGFYDVAIRRPASFCVSADSGAQ